MNAIVVVIAGLLLLVGMIAVLIADKRPPVRKPTRRTATDWGGEPTCGIGVVYRPRSFSGDERRVGQRSATPDTADPERPDFPALPATPPPAPAARGRPRNSGMRRML